MKISVNELLLCVDVWHVKGSGQWCRRGKHHIDFTCRERDAQAGNN